MQTREQKYAMDVYKRVSTFKSDPKKPDIAGYGSMAHKLPILIRTAGLAQALSFVESRGNDAHKQLLTDVAGTVGQSDLVATARSAELSDYMRLTQQVMAALLWYKRFAQSVLGVDVTQAAMEEQEQ